MTVFFRAISAKVCRAIAHITLGKVPSVKAPFIKFRINVLSATLNPSLFTDLLKVEEFRKKVVKSDINV